MTRRSSVSAAAAEGRQGDAKERIERSIAIFAEVGADNYIPHLQIIRYLIDKQALPACEARPWLAGILRKALKIREFYDVYWSLAAIPYALLIDRTPRKSHQLPSPVSLAAEMRAFVGKSLDYGRSAYMRALVHDEVDDLLRQWPQAPVEAAAARGGRQELWALAASVLDFLGAAEIEPSHKQR